MKCCSSNEPLPQYNATERQRTDVYSIDMYTVPRQERVSGACVIQGTGQFVLFTAEPETGRPYAELSCHLL